jgi:hypothetical protein
MRSFQFIKLDSGHLKKVSLQVRALYMNAKDLWNRIHIQNKILCFLLLLFVCVCVCVCVWVREVKEDEMGGACSTNVSHWERGH